MKGNIWIPGILEVFCLQTLESGILGFGIKYSAQRIPSSDWNPQSTIHVPLAKNPESSSWRPQSTAWNPESKIVLDYLTRGNGSPPQLGGGDLYSLIYRVCTLFLTEFKKIKEVHKNFLAPIRRQNGGDRLELVW